MQPDRTLDYYLQQTLRRFERGEVVDEMRVENAYRRLAGDFICSFTTSILYSRGTLSLRIAAAALRHEMFVRRENLRRRINDELGAEVVRRIIIR